MKNKVLLIVALLCMIAFTGCSFKFGANADANSSNANANSNTNGTTDPGGSGGTAGDAIAGAEALVADLYKAHDGKRSPFFQTKDRGLVDKYFTKQLADLIWKDATSSQNEVGAIDGDPLYNAQDTEIKNFAIGKAEANGNGAKVPVTFTNFGKKETVTFSLARAGEGWKIDNILYGGGDSLLKWLKDTYSGKNETSATSSSGEFEGKYVVGPTTCVVKPIKMAFEVKWAKGSGVETFYFKDGTTFESEPPGNRFVFDDENYNSGTFYRADGKSMPIRRG